MPFPLSRPPSRRRQAPLQLAPHHLGLSLSDTSEEPASTAPSEVGNSSILSWIFFIALLTTWNYLPVWSLSFCPMKQEHCFAHQYPPVPRVVSGTFLRMRHERTWAACCWVATVGTVRPEGNWENLYISYLKNKQTKRRVKRTRGMRRPGYDHDGEGSGDAVTNGSSEGPQRSGPALKWARESN